MNRKNIRKELINVITFLNNHKLNGIISKQLSNLIAPSLVINKCSELFELSANLWFLCSIVILWVINLL